MVLTHMCIIFFLLRFRSCAEGSSFIFSHDTDNQKVLPDYGTKWFDQPKPKRIRGPPIGKPFLPDKQSPYKVYDAAVTANPFDQGNSDKIHENTKTVTRSTQVNDSKLSQTINGDTYYGLKSPEDRNDFKEKASTYEQMQNDIENAKGLPYPSSDTISPERIEEETRVVEQPLQHSASINNEITQNLEGIRNVPLSKLNSDHHSRSEDQRIRDFDVNDLKKDDESVASLVDNIKDEDKTGVVHMSEADVKSVPDNPKHESPGIPELDAISSETEALHLSRHFGDTFPQTPEETKNIKDGHMKKHSKAHRYLPGHFNPLLEIIHAENEGKKVPAHNSKENRHHHLTIDTDTGEILNEAKTSSGTSMPVNPLLKEHFGHLSNSKYHHNWRIPLKRKKNRTKEARPNSRHHLHQPEIHFLSKSPTGIHRHEEQEVNELDDESLKILPSHRKHHFNDIGDGDDGDLYPPQSYGIIQNEFTEDRKSSKSDHDEELSEINEIIRSDHDKERKSMPEVEDAHEDEETDGDDGDNDEGPQMKNIHPSFASQKYNKDLEMAISENHAQHYGSSKTHHNDGSSDHVHEDESFANEELENEDETRDESNSMKKSSKGHSLVKGKKKHYPNEPKIVKQHELVEPSFMLHEDPHGDGLGNGDITGIELGNSNNNTNAKNTKDPDKRWKDLSMNENDMGLLTEKNVSRDEHKDLKDYQEDSRTKDVKEANVGNDDVKPGKIKARIVSNKFITNIGTPQDEVNVEIDTKDIQNMIKSSLLGMSQEKHNSTSPLDVNEKVHQPVLTDWEMAARHEKESSSTNMKGNTEVSVHSNKTPSISENSRDFYDSEISSFKGNEGVESKQDDKNANTDFPITKPHGILISSNLQNPKKNEEEGNERKAPSVNTAIKTVEQHDERKHFGENDALRMEQQKQEMTGLMNSSSKDAMKEATSNGLKSSTDSDSDDRQPKNAEVNDKSLKPSVKHKLISNIQEHLKGFEIDELSAIQDQLQQLHKEKMKDDKERDNGNQSKDDRLDLDVKSTKYLIPDHQLTLPITNPGHPDDSNGVPSEKNTETGLKPVLLNPSPTHSLVEKSGYVMEPVKTEKAAVKNIIMHSKVSSPRVKVTGMESEFDLQPFVVASKANTIYMRHHHKYVDQSGNARSKVTSPVGSKHYVMSTKSDNIPTFKPDRSPLNHYNQKITKLRQIIDKAPSHLEFDRYSPIRKTSHLTVSPLKPSIYRRALISAKERLEAPIDEYNAKQYFIKELVENIDKPKARRRVLSMKRNAI